MKIEILISDNSTTVSACVNNPEGAKRIIDAVCYPSPRVVGCDPAARMGVVLNDDNEKLDTPSDAWILHTPGPCPVDCMVDIRTSQCGEYFNCDPRQFRWDLPITMDSAIVAYRKASLVRGGQQ